MTPSSSSETKNKQPVRTTVNGTAVRSFGDTFIYGISPDFLRDVKLQAGVATPKQKLQPKMSHEIRRNLFGATPPRMPRTEAMDFQPLLPINLIDGDAETYWCSRSQAQPDVEPVWIRIDLARETNIRAVNLVPRKDKQGTAEDLVIKVSRDAWHWDTAYENRHCPAPTGDRPLEFAFRSRPAKQIWIIGNKFGMVERNFGFCFSLAEVQVIADDGTNVALISNGGSVTVSSTNYGYGTERLLHEALWSTHFDLGLKWVRVGYWYDVINWNFVEQEKGKYVIDSRADAAITECVENGAEVVMCLAYNNWLYTPEGKRPRGKQIWEIPYDMTPRLPTDTPEMMVGFKNYVRFMVRHFRDRIRYFEIWNEQNLPIRHWGRGYAFGETPAAAREFSQLIKEVAPIIREEAPKAKVMLGSTGGLAADFQEVCLKEGVGKLVDAIGWHPFYHLEPENPYYRNYVADVQKFKTLAAAHGFKGEYMATEWAYSAAYPPLTDGLMVCTELTKAKYLVRTMIIHAWLDVVSFWNETWAGCRAGWSIGLFRWTFSADPLSPTQPEPAYYAFRTLCTVFDDTKPAEIAVKFDQPNPTQSFDRDPYLTFETFAFTRGNEKLVAIWVAGSASDNFRDVPVDVALPGQKCKRVTCIDILNGNEQELRADISSDGVHLKGMLLKDYPLVLRLHA